MGTLLIQTQTETETALNRAAAGDQMAFAEIVREHQSMVWSICWHYLRDQSIAEELGQEVFLHLHRHLRDIESPAHLTYWLRKVTAHRCIDQARRAKLRPRVGLEDAPEPVARTVEADPLLAGTLRKLLQKLPERARAIVVLRFQEEMEPAEIAEMLEIPLGTVKSNLHRSLAFLRVQLERTSVKGARP